MPEDMPGRMPEDMPDRMPEDMPDKMPEDMPDRLPEGMPDKMSYRMPEGMPDKVPECLPDRMPEDLPDRMPDRVSEDMPENMPDRMPDRMQEDMPEHMPEDMPGRMPDRVPEHMPEDMSDRMPEDLPVTKRINVMVGMTRSKVIESVVWWTLFLGVSGWSRIYIYIYVYIYIYIFNDYILIVCVYLNYIYIYYVNVFAQSQIVMAYYPLIRWGRTSLGFICEPRDLKTTHEMPRPGTARLLGCLTCFEIGKNRCKNKRKPYPPTLQMMLVTSYDFMWFYILAIIGRHTKYHEYPPLVSHVLWQHIWYPNQLAHWCTLWLTNITMENHNLSWVNPL